MRGGVLGKLSVHPALTLPQPKPKARSLGITEEVRMAEIIVRRREVEKLTGLSRSTIYERLNPNSPYHDPTFPRPVKIGVRAVGWRLGEIAAWQKSRKSSLA